MLESIQIRSLQIIIKWIYMYIYSISQFLYNGRKTKAALENTTLAELKFKLDPAHAGRTRQCASRIDQPAQAGTDCRPAMPVAHRLNRGIPSLIKSRMHEKWPGLGS